MVPKITLLPTRAITLPLYFCEHLQSHRTTFCTITAMPFSRKYLQNRVSQSINTTPSCLVFFFLSLLLVNATAEALPLLEPSFTSAVRVWEMCQTSRAAAEQSPALPVCFGTGGMHRSSQWVSGGAALWSLPGDVILFLAPCTLENPLQRVLSAAAAVHVFFLRLGRGDFSVTFAYETPQWFCCWDYVILLNSH